MRGKRRKEKERECTEVMKTNITVELFTTTMKDDELGYTVEENTLAGDLSPLSSHPET